jgi:hypothetical protein
VNFRMQTMAKTTSMPTSSFTAMRSGFLQRRGTGQAKPDWLPLIAHGAPQRATCAPREGRFGHDFSQVPVHADTPVALQAKPTVGEPGDKYEQEADKVADVVMRMPETHLIRSMRGGGQPLSSSAREFFEPRMGRDFSQVRVHTDARAAGFTHALKAKAFTTGRDIFFAPGQHDPHSQPGKRLLGHELAHVVQQAEGVVASRIQREITVTDPKKTSSHHKQNDGDVVVGLFNKLCPDTTWKLDAKGKLGAVNADICKPANLQKGGKTSCECVCHFLTTAGPHAIISIHPTDNETRHGTQPNTFEIKLTGRAGSAKGVQGKAGTGSPLKTIPDPAWLILGHELCGHAMTTMRLNKPGGEVTYSHEMTKDWDKTAIDVENRIRREHSNKGVDLGIRAGDFLDTDRNLHHGSLIRLPVSMQLLALLKKFSVPIGFHYARCTERRDLFYLQCPALRQTKNLRKVPMLSRVAYRLRGNQKIAYACKDKTFPKGTYFAVEGVFWHLTTKGETKATIAAKWGVSIPKLDRANLGLNTLSEFSKSDPLPANISVVIPYRGAPGKQRYFFSRYTGPC